MSDSSIPDLFDVSPETQQAAQAAMQVQELTPPDTAVVATDKNGNVYKRWNESAVVEGSWRETTKTGLIAFVVAGKIRMGMPNGGRRFWARHFVSPDIMRGAATDEQKKKYEFMSNKAINALTTLLQATGLAPKSGGIKAQLLQHLFPPKGTQGKSLLADKAVVVNFVDQPNTGANAKSPRQVNTESYLPDVPQD